MCVRVCVMEWGCCLRRLHVTNWEMKCSNEVLKWRLLQEFAGFIVSLWPGPCPLEYIRWHSKQSLCTISMSLRSTQTQPMLNKLQHTITHCNTLQRIDPAYLVERTATHCNTLKYTKTYCNTLQHTTIRCNTLQHTATHCNTYTRPILNLESPTSEWSCPYTLILISRPFWYCLSTSICLPRGLLPVDDLILWYVLATRGHSLRTRLRRPWSISSAVQAPRCTCPA